MLPVALTEIQPVRRLQVADIQYLTISHLTIRQIKRLFKKIHIDSNGCWNWQGARDAAGYGFFGITDQGKVYQTRVHRIVYAWAVGPIPRGVEARKIGQIDHLCRNTSCCNPVHLELVTQQVNVARGISPVAEAMKRTHCIHGHPLTKIRNGKRRECKTCDSIRHKTRVLGVNGERYREMARRAARKYYDKHLKIR